MQVQLAAASLVLNYAVASGEGRLPPEQGRWASTVGRRRQPRGVLLLCDLRAGCTGSTAGRLSGRAWLA